MRTPDAFLLERIFSKDPRTCTTCGKQLRGAQERFCSAKCRSGPNANARKAIERVKKFLEQTSLDRNPLTVLHQVSVHLESHSAISRRYHIEARLDVVAS